MSQQKIYTKGDIAYKKQNLEHNCVLQESCKTVRRWQSSVLVVKGGHCVGDWSICTDLYLNRTVSILNMF